MCFEYDLYEEAEKNKLLERELMKKPHQQVENKEKLETLERKEEKPITV